MKEVSPRLVVRAADMAKTDRISITLEGVEVGAFASSVINIATESFAKRIGLSGEVQSLSSSSGGVKEAIFEMDGDRPSEEEFAKYIDYTASVSAATLFAIYMERNVYGAYTGSTPIGELTIDCDNAEIETAIRERYDKLVTTYKRGLDGLEQV